MAIKGASFELFLLENIFYKNTGYKDEGMLYILSFLFQKIKTNKHGYIVSMSALFLRKENSQYNKIIKKRLLFQKASIHWHKTTNSQLIHIKINYHTTSRSYIALKRKKKCTQITAEIKHASIIK